MRTETGERLRKFMSTKFIVTMTGMLVAAVLAYFGKEVPSGVLTTGIGAYNIADGWVTGKAIERNGE